MNVSQSGKTGYQSTAYAYSLAEFGQPFPLPNAGGWILKRPIPNSPHYDAMGCYPIFACQNWNRLESDINDLGERLIALSLITDPFASVDKAVLRNCFPDLMYLFKQHFVVDLSLDPMEYLTKHHQRNTKKSLAQVTVELCENPISLLEQWSSLYKVLIKQHNIKGISRFSKVSFAAQLAMEEMIAFRAKVQDELVGMILWLQQGNVAYYHLGAYSSVGYQAQASFALFWHSIHHFRSLASVEWLSLGAGAGITTDADDGLTRFKRGWATGTLPVYMCGKIFDHKIYHSLVVERNNPETPYFPAYRLGEFE
jgi:hypothetical protein